MRERLAAFEVTDHLKSPRYLFDGKGNTDKVMDG